MKDWKFSIDNVLNAVFCCILVCYLFMLYGLSSMSEYIISLCTYGIFGIWILLFGGAIISEKHFRQRSFILFVLIVLTILVLVGKDVNRDTMISAFSYIMMLTVWIVAANIRLSRFSRNFVIFITMSIGFLLISLSYSEYAYVVREDIDYIMEALTLGFSNPNQAAIIVYSTIAVLLVQYDTIKNTYIKWVVLAEIIWLFYLLILTDARTSILACLFVVVMKLINNFKLVESRVTRVNNGMLLFICVLPILFYWLYTYLYEHRILVGVEFLGKDLFSGRNEVYNHSIDMWENKLFGNMERFSFENSHNASLTILLNTGIIGYLLYFVYTYLELVSLNKKRIMNFLPVVVILSYFIMGCAETAILTGGNIYYVMLQTICVLANNANE